MDWLTGRFMLPPQGSAFADQVDSTFLGIYWLSVVLFRSLTAGKGIDLPLLLSPLTCLALGIAGALLCAGLAWLARKDPSIVLPYVLVAVVGLLSAEWLTRKLLRLA